MQKNNNSTASRALLRKVSLGMSTKLSRAVFFAIAALFLSTTFNGLFVPSAHASADTNIYNSSGDLYLEINIYDSDPADPADPNDSANITDPTDSNNSTNTNTNEPTDANNSGNATDPAIKSPNTAFGNSNGQYTTKITYDILSRSASDNRLTIAIIAIVTLGLSVLAVYLVRKYLKKTGLVNKNSSKRNQTNSQNLSIQQNPTAQSNTPAIDPNTEVINISKLLKKHKAKRIILQTAPVIAFVLVGLGVSWAVIKSYASTISTDNNPVNIELTCTPEEDTQTCLKFANGADSDPFIINIPRSSLVGNGNLVTGSTQIHVLLQNIPNATGSMQLQAKLANSPDSNITNIKLADSATLTTDNETIAYRTEPGLNTINNNLSISFIIDKTIANGTYPIKINTTLIPDTLQTFNKEDPIYANITPIDGQSTTQAVTNATLTLPDARDNKLYRIRKFTTHPDNQSAPDTQIAWWWMIDNLAFDLENEYAPVYSPEVTRILYGQGNIYSSNKKSQYVTTSGALTADMGYLYNYCAAVADTSINCTDSATPGINVNMPNSICPASISANWRLPHSINIGSWPYYDVTANDFAWLNGLMNQEEDATIDGWDVNNPTNHYLNWISSGVWQGALSGYRTNGVVAQGESGRYWSATSDYGIYAYSLVFEDTIDRLAVHGGASDRKDYSLAVRCVL